MQTHFCHIPYSVCCIHVFFKNGADLLDGIAPHKQPTAINIGSLTLGRMRGERGTTEADDTGLNQRLNAFFMFSVAC